jgi:hypothetical protein
MIYRVILLFGIALSLVISSGNTLQSFGQLGQGLVRCTAGNLVRSASECPSTDICPPPQTELNSVVSCSLRERPEASSVSQAINGNETEAVNITTDRKTYKIGDIVKILVNNTGNQPLSFSNSTTQIIVRNLNTNQSYPVSSTGPVRFTLDAGASRTFTWDQRDEQGQQVNAGNYSSSVSLGSLNANTTFSIL